MHAVQCLVVLPICRPPCVPAPRGGFLMGGLAAAARSKLIHTTAVHATAQGHAGGTPAMVGARGLPLPTPER